MPEITDTEAARLLDLIRKFADENMSDLRAVVGVDESDYARRQELQGATKGDLVAAAVYGEFPHLFDPNWEIS